jgi:hypothetical protein
MIAVVTVLSAFALGFFVKSRLAANTTYAVAYLWAFTYQTMYLTLDSFSGTSENPAFEPETFPWAYGVVALSIFLVGFGLVEAGRRVATRRRARSAAPVAAG